MTCHVVGRHGRAGQDELTRTASGRVNLPANLVPDRRNKLPLVDQSWPIPVEEQGRRQEAGRTRFIIDIEANLAGRRLPRGFCLATASRAVDHHRAGRRGRTISWASATLVGGCWESGIQYVGNP